MPVITGGPSQDILVGTAGDDTINGLGDNDILNGGAGNDSLTGDDGADHLSDFSGDDTLAGGAGDDFLTHSNGAGLLIGGDGNDTLVSSDASRLDGGAGADALSIFGHAAAAVSGGAGADTFTLDAGLGQAIDDFQAGAGGDVLDLEHALESTTFQRGNPFAAGYVSLVQNGADTRVLLDRDGPGGVAAETYAVLRNVQAGQLVAANFGGYGPDGGLPSGVSVSTGTPAGQTSTAFGTVGHDTLTGGAGGDNLYGYGGNDRIVGGDGSNFINGGFGDDSLAGGAGFDQIVDSWGANTISAGASADFITVGGDGSVLDAGAGDDQISAGGRVTITGGDGREDYTLALGGQLTITDFQPGEGGDFIEVPFAFIATFPPVNPFAAGYLKVVQDGADVRVLADTDGFAGPAQPQLWVTLEDVAVWQLTRHNFGFGPGGGSQANDTLTAGGGFTYLRGEDGDDRLIGSAGFDDMNGNMGADTLVAGAGDDWVVGGKDDDLLNGEAGDDIVLGNIGVDWCDGGAGNDIIRGGKDADHLFGQEGDDWLSGDRGADTLTGGAGADIFHSFADAGIDRVLDFNAAEGDRVQIDLGSAYTLSQVGADVVVDFGGGNDGPNQLILVNVSLAGLPQGWIFTA